MQREPAIDTESEDKLHWLHRLDHHHEWKFLDEERYCLRCGRTFTGRQALLIGGTRPHGPLRFRCPTLRCPSTQVDWVLPTEVEGKYRSRATFSVFQGLGVGYKNNIWRRYSPSRPKRGQLKRPKLRSALHVVRYFGTPV